MALLLISLLLFIGVTTFCRSQGLFRAGSMGFGQLCAFLLYVAVWLVPSLAMAVGYWLA
jgi:hypothetical protein